MLDTNIISVAHIHTIKKFMLIEKYTESWAYKIIQNRFCNKMIFIDCMCSSGEYVSDNNETIYGTPVRVSNILYNIAKKNTNKQIHLYFNDYSKEKIQHLAGLLPNNLNNFRIFLSNGDGNQLLKQEGKKIINTSGTHYLLLYDPYTADIDWDAIGPFLCEWGEVILNHMVSDTIRAIPQVKAINAIKKYENTYLSDIKDLIPFGSNREAYEERLETIMKNIANSVSRQYYISAFPFFNRCNALLYNLVHFTRHIEGFRLYKKIAWQTFGGKSSIKNKRNNNIQTVFNFNNFSLSKNMPDEYCYTISDIAEYLQETFLGQQNISLSAIWSLLAQHPIFPADGFRNEIKNELKSQYNDVEKNGEINFTKII